MIKIKNQKIKITLLVVALAVFVMGFLFYSINKVLAAGLQGGSLSLSDGSPSATAVTYTLDFDNVTTSAIKCIQVKFNTEADGGGSVPTGLSTQSGPATYDADNSDFVPDVQTWAADTSANGIIKITNGTGETPASASDRTLVINGVVNGSVADTAYFAIVNTYNNTNCTDSGVDSGTVTFIFTTGQAVSLTVDPSISFSVAAVAIGQSVNGAAVNVLTTTSTIPFSTVTASTNAIGAHDLIVGTNASNGYTIYTKYSGAPDNGTDTIDDHTGTHAAPSTMSAGTEAFGYTTEDTDISAFQTNKYSKFLTTNESVALRANSTASETTRIGYQVGVSSNTPAGTYETTVVLTCTPFY